MTTPGGHVAVGPLNHPSFVSTGNECGEPHSREDDLSMASLGPRMYGVVLVVWGLSSIGFAVETTKETSSGSREVASASSTWLMTIPTADTLPQGDYVLGIIQGGTIPFQADVGALWKHLQVGVRGVKLGILEEGKPWAAIALGATFGFYPSGIYVVGSKRVQNLRLHLGARFLPFDFADDTTSDTMNATASPSTDSMGTTSDSGDSFMDTFELFGGIEKEMVEGRVRLMLEVGNTLNGGFRFDVSPSWNFDVGVRVGLPERIRRTIGKKGEAFAFTSRDATAYLAFTYLSNWRLMGPPKEIPDIESDPSAAK